MSTSSVVPQFKNKIHINKIFFTLTTKKVEEKEAIYLKQDHSNKRSTLVQFKTREFNFGFSRSEDPGEG